MIQITYHTTLWSRLAQYAFAAVMAKRWNYFLPAHPIPGFPGTYTPMEGRTVAGPALFIAGPSPYSLLSRRPLPPSRLAHPPDAHVTVVDPVYDFRLYSAAERDFLRARLACSIPPPRGAREEALLILPSPVESAASASVAALLRRHPGARLVTSLPREDVPPEETRFADAFEMVALSRRARGLILPRHPLNWFLALLSPEVPLHWVDEEWFSYGCPGTERPRGIHIPSPRETASPSLSLSSGSAAPRRAAGESPPLTETILSGV